MNNTKEVLEVLPEHIANIIKGFKQQDKIQEIRMKVNKPLILQVGNDEIITGYTVLMQDIKEVLKHISNYSIYAFEEEIKQGYLTISGGHRVGICGSCIIENNKVKTIKSLGSLNIRVCHEIIGCSNKVMPYIVNNNQVFNTVIISPPRCGKTTLVRDIARNLSEGLENRGFKGKKVCIIDERSEISSSYNGIPQMNLGIRTDVLDNCPKAEGIMMAIRSMAPDVIVCDEIGTYKDMDSILMALNSGVKLITTIHGFGVEDLYNRPVFKEIMDNHIFKKAIILSSANGVGTIEYIYDFEKQEKQWRR
jgi:stage III sporulation protein AA